MPFPTSKKLRLAVLISGGGTNLQALLDRSATGVLAGEVVVVVSDRLGAYGLERAVKAGVPAHVVDYKRHLQQTPDSLEDDIFVNLKKLDKRQRILSDPDSHKRLDRLACLVRAEYELIKILDSYHPDLICLAGYMRLFTPFFLDYYNREEQYRVLNIHPALLPAFPGRHGYEDTFEYGCKWGGVTVHFVDEGEDSGPVIAQAIYPVWPDDHIEKIRRRGLQLEYEVYAQCINWLAYDQVRTESGPGQRKRACITDPLYPSVLQSWVQMAFDEA